MLGSSIENNFLLFDHYKDEARRCLFLDRDGVINRDFGYVHKWSDVEFMPNILNVMRHFEKLGYLIVIVTNQSGIARGYYTERQFVDLMIAMKRYFKENKIKISGIFYCPHHVDGVDNKFAFHCNCRKPLPGLVESAIQRLNIDLEYSIMVGDNITDVEAGKRAGLKRNFLLQSTQELVTADVDEQDFTVITDLRELLHLT